MDLLDVHYLNEDHTFQYDNAMTHRKCANDSLSICHMPNNGKRQSENWGVKVLQHGTDGQPVYGHNRKPLKVFKLISGAWFSDSQPQDLYFPESHPMHPRLFKGMAQILEECSFNNAQSLKAECKNFKCAAGSTDCCCCHILFNQPDFANVKSLLEELCEQHGYAVIFLPKFHLELNFIEMCWGYAKWVYCQSTISSDPNILQRHTISALESVPLMSM
ncbi:hypothetical protein BS47DRAFT_1293399 [Hydnum rufescens UP504]|uniref:Uncharacterized protein n=1 Tax=Hydnum rufescens UP504 TaxID=1448309 RepID=A0A9P6B198_9AGAM|nr:hypothetical protein BS47DRAFT_1293399 [Hydnum rufescens UP504]